MTVWLWWYQPAGSSHPPIGSVEPGDGAAGLGLGSSGDPGCLAQTVRLELLAVEDEEWFCCGC